MSTDGRGRATGWSAYYHDGVWQWSAYGPNGGTAGTAHTKEEATMRAVAAEEALKRAPTITGDTEAGR